jgi:hypothetical protein
MSNILQNIGNLVNVAVNKVLIIIIIKGDHVKVWYTLI